MQVLNLLAASAVLDFFSLLVKEDKCEIASLATACVSPGQKEQLRQGNFWLIFPLCITLTLGHKSTFVSIFFASPNLRPNVQMFMDEKKKKKKERTNERELEKK